MQSVPRAHVPENSEPAPPSSQSPSLECTQVSSQPEEPEDDDVVELEVELVPEVEVVEVVDVVVVVDI